MTDQERKDDYEKSANELWRWIIAGESLIRAARYLQRINSSKTKALMKKIRTGKLPKRPLPADFGVKEQEMYLKGKCLEVYIKAAFLKKGIQLTTGKGKLKPLIHKHNLNLLCDQIKFKRNEQEKQTLERLTKAVEFWGTYPIPSTHLDWRPDVSGITGMQPIYVLGPKDDKNFNNILRRIESLVNQ